MEVTAVLPDGTLKPLVRIPAYDFNWQIAYIFKQPMVLPKGTRINVLAWYDNTLNNAHNPHKPPVTVRWGEATTDEMLVAYFTYVLKNERPAPAFPR